MKLFSRLVVDNAYRLKSSSRYQNAKQFFYNILENNSYPYKKFLDIFMIVLIFISVAVLVREVKYPVNDFFMLFNDYIISVVFLIEYLLRLWVYSSSSEVIIKEYEDDVLLSRDFRLFSATKKIVAKKIEYITSVQAIIDFLAIVPFFHQVRLLRIFILFRVFKLFRYATRLQSFLSILKSKKFEFATLFTFASIVIFISSVLIYIMEANNENSPINSLFDAFYWSIVTISTVGYGDVTPITPAGQTVAIAVITAGIAVLAFTTSLIVSAFTEKLDEIIENKAVEDIYKLKKLYLICGITDVSLSVAKKLESLEKEFIILDKDEGLVKNVRDRGYHAFALDPSNMDNYALLGIDFEEKIEAVLSLHESDVENVSTALSIRAIHSNVKILSTLEYGENRKKLKLAGVSEIVYIQELIGLIAKEFSGQPVAFEAIHTIRSSELGVNISEITVDEIIAEHYRCLKDYSFTKFRLVLLGIYSKESTDFMFTIEDEYVIAEGDILLCVGEKRFIEAFKIELHSKRS